MQRPPARVTAVAVAARGALALLSPAGRARVPLTRGAQPSWAPDGRRLAFVRDREVYVLDVVTRRVSRLTQDATADTAPAWSPDGRQLAWAADDDVFVMGTPLIVGPGRDTEPAWGPDGGRLVFASDRAGTFDLWSIELASGAVEPLVALPGDERDPAVAPDGRAVAFTETVDGNADVYVATLDGTPPVRLTTAPGFDGQPAWSPDGRTIVFTSVRAGRTGIWAMRSDGSRKRPLPAARPDDQHPALARAAVARLLPLPDERLPDLDQRAPSGLVVARAHGRALLAFASAVDNVGTGPLWIRGNRPSRHVAAMRADQLVELGGGGVRAYRDVGRLRYESHRPHFHWHLQTFDRYELRRARDFTLVARDRKAGFCLADHYGTARRRVQGFRGPRFLGSCGTNDRSLLGVEQGSSIGYTDRYPALFHGQDIDVTGVPPGTYVLVHRANPDRRFKELRYDNNAASLLLRLTWPAGRRAAPHVRVLARCESSDDCRRRRSAD